MQIFMNIKYWWVFGAIASLSYGLATLILLCLYGHTEIYDNQYTTNKGLWNEKTSYPGFFIVISNIINLIAFVCLGRLCLQLLINPNDKQRLNCWGLTSYICSFIATFVCFIIFFTIDQYYEISTPLYLLLLIIIHAITGCLGLLLLYGIFYVIIVCLWCVWQQCRCDSPESASQRLVETNEEPPLPEMVNNV